MNSSAHRNAVFSKNVVTGYVVIAPQDVVSPENVLAPDDVVAPQDVLAPEDVVAPQNVLAPDDAVAPQAVVAPRDRGRPRRQVSVHRVSVSGRVVPDELLRPSVLFAADRGHRLNAFDEPPRSHGYSGVDDACEVDCT